LKERTKNAFHGELTKAVPKRTKAEAKNGGSFFTSIKGVGIRSSTRAILMVPLGGG